MRAFEGIWWEGTVNGPNKVGCTSCWPNGSSERVGRVEYTSHYFHSKEQAQLINNNNTESFCAECLLTVVTHLSSDICSWRWLYHCCFESAPKGKQCREQPLH